MSRTERFNIELNATDSASGMIDDVAAKTEALPTKAEIELAAEDEASDVIEDVETATGELDGTAAEVELAAEDEASDTVEQVGEATGDLDGTAATVELDATDDATPAVDDAATTLSDFDGTTASATIDATDDVSGAVDSATAALGAFEASDASTATGSIDVDENASDAATDATEALDAFENDPASSSASGEIDVDENASDATSAVSEAFTAFEEDPAASTADAEINVDEDADSAVGDVATSLSEFEASPESEASAEINVEGDDAGDVTEVTEALSELNAAPDATASMEVTGASEANDDIGGIVDSLGVIGAGALTGLAAGGLSSVFSGAADHVLEVQGLATATGDSLDNASGLIEAFDFVGVSANKLFTFITKVNDKLSESPEIADDLGIIIGENQSPLDIFVTAVDALNSGQLTANERLSLATELFGRKGALSVLAIGTQVGDLSDAIEDIPEWQVVTEDDIRQAIEFKRTMDDLGDLAEEAAQQFLTKFGPAITNTLQLANNLGTVVGDMRTPDVTGLGNWLDALAPEELDRITNSFYAYNANIEALLFNVEALDAVDIDAALSAGIPPEVLATAKLTGGAYDLLGQRMADTVDTAGALHQAFVDGKVSQQEWLAATADGVITLDEVQAAIGDTDAALDENVEAVDEAAAAAARHEAAVEAEKDEINKEIDALETSIERHKDVAEAVDSAADAWLSQRDAVRNAEDAVDDYHQALEPVTDDTRTDSQVQRDHEAALDAVVAAYVKVADGAVDVEREQRAATGATLSDIDALDVHNSSLIEQARTLQGPERKALLEHTLRINGIPESRITKIFSDNDPNDLAQVERELANSSRSRQALILAQLDAYSKAIAEQQLAALERTRYATIVANVIRGSNVGSLFGQAGSPHTTPGAWVVGEHGPEIVEMPEGAVIHPNPQSAEMMRNRHGGGDTYNETTINNWPAGTPSSNVRQLRRYRRRNGQIEGIA
jgi:hypothetical protein